MLSHRAYNSVMKSVREAQKELLRLRAAGQMGGWQRKRPKQRAQPQKTSRVERENGEC